MGQKVFCIGFHKTGTTSLGVALEQLGYSVTGPDGVDDPKIATNMASMTDRLLEEYDAFQDNPWPLLFKDLDKRFPGSKFIVTLRDPDAWMKSQLRHFGSKVTPMRQWIYGKQYGCPQGNETVYLERFNRHYSDLFEYFKDRPDDLLVMDFSKGDSWEKLCPFLGKRIPSTAFPHANKADEREKNQSRHNNPFLRLKDWLSRLIRG